MKTFALAAALAATLTTAAAAQDAGAIAATDGMPRTTTKIYVVPGVINDPSIGLATAFICHNDGTAPVDVSIVVRTGGGLISGARAFPIPGNNTVTYSTRATTLFFEGAGGDLGARDGVVRQGRAFISASSRNVHCSAHVVSTTSTLPNTIDLHMVRFNPVVGSTE
ncbi:MAG: hypothetical protein MUC58_06425 [Rhizobiaceae bacterium]|nr:hypothetical protein [Rhizobiaceae bacterium]